MRDSERIKKFFLQSLQKLVSFSAFITDEGFKGQDSYMFAEIRRKLKTEGTQL